MSSQLTGKLRQEDYKARLGYSMSSRELGETVSQNQKHKSSRHLPGTGLIPILKKKIKKINYDLPNGCKQ